MGENFRDYSQLEMLKDQVIRSDEELLILLKRRIQTNKKIAENIKKNGIEKKELNSIKDEIFSKSLSKAKEMDIDGMFANEIFALLEQHCSKKQKEIFEKK